MDSWSKGYKTGQPDLTVIRCLPNGFQDVLAPEFKNPNGKRQVERKTTRLPQTLKRIMQHRHYSGVQLRGRYYWNARPLQTVFAKAQTPAIQDEANAHNFAKHKNPQCWCNKLGSKPALLEECEKRHISANEVYIKSNREIASILIKFDKELRNC